jgi:hypothetical protein
MDEDIQNRCLEASLRAVTSIYVRYSERVKYPSSGVPDVE